MQIVYFGFLEDPFIIPFLFNCQRDNERLISTSVPTGNQQNATFVLDIRAWANTSELYADENGAWKMTGCRPKHYTIVKDEDGRVAELERVQDQSKLWLCCPEKNIHVLFV